MRAQGITDLDFLKLFQLISLLLRYNTDQKQLKEETVYHKLQRITEGSQGRYMELGADAVS